MAQSRTHHDRGAAIPEQTYHAVPRRASRRANGRRRHPGRRSSALLLLILGAILFCAGFIFGKAATVLEKIISDAPAASSQERNAGIILTSPSIPSRSDGDVPWNLILVNGAFPLPEDFTVPELTQLKNGHAIDSRVYPALQDMMDAARAEGLQPLICSSFRTWEEQNRLFQNKVQAYLEQGFGQQEAEEQAAMWVARPGTGEHQAGLAVDVVDASYQMLDEGQENTAVQKWFMSHCAEYGFILRYPAEKSDLTGVNYEPWHYRYVGIEAAQEIMGQGICLEEYFGR